MLGHIASVKMVNIQSWLNNEMEFTIDELNVIIGRNETGKSVLIKIFRQMCFPTFHGRTGRKKLIRRGKDFGMLIMNMVSGSKITFELYDTYQVYRYQKDGHEQVFKQNSLPEEIRQELGWYIDEKFKILLNVVDLEMSMPFVDTTTDFNARVLRFVTEHPELETAVENLKEWVKELEELESMESHTIKIVEGKYGLYEYTDMFEVEQSYKMLERLVPAIEDLTSIAEGFEKLGQLIKPEELPLNEEFIKSVLKNIDDISELQNFMQSLSTLSKPKELTLNENVVQDCLNGIKISEELQSIFNNLTTLSKPQVIEINENKIKKLMTLERDCISVQSDLIQLSNLNKPNIVKINESTINDILVIDKQIYQLQSALKQLSYNSDMKLRTELKMDTISKQISELEKELGICPLCGSSFGEEQEHCVPM